MVGPIRNVNYDKRLKRCGGLWWKKLGEKEVENRELIKYSDYHTMKCETPTWSASNHELLRWEKGLNAGKILLARTNLKTCKAEICSSFYFTP